MARGVQSVLQRKDADTWRAGEGAGRGLARGGTLCVMTNSTEKKITQRLLLPAILLVVLVLFPALFVYRFTRGPTVEDIADLGAVELATPVSVTLPPLVDHRGRPFGEEQLGGQWNMFFFGFTHCPDVCPATLSVFRRLSERLAAGGETADLRCLMVSVDPARDTPERLAEWLERYGDEVVGLTGPLSSIRQLARDFGVPFQKMAHDGDHYDMSHGVNIFLVGPDGRRYGFARPPHEPLRLERIYRAFRARA